MRFNDSLKEILYPHTPEGNPKHSSKSFGSGNVKIQIKDKRQKHLTSKAPQKRTIVLSIDKNVNWLPVVSKLLVTVRKAALATSRAKTCPENLFCSEQDTSTSFSTCLMK